jgi:hypothetical protein
LPRQVGDNSLADEHRGLPALRLALISSAAGVLLAGSADPAAAQYGMGYYGGGGWYSGRSYYAPPRHHRSTTAKTKQDKSQPKKEAGFGEMPKGPLQVVVTIGTQRVTLYSNGQRVAQGPISTGVPGHPTPTGVFSVIEKDRYHHSNLYSGAPMPYMQRITWSGVALHEGVLPGHPASHGCIRMSRDFAMKLWPITKLGVRVVVAREEVAPVEFAHPKLFVPKPKPVDQVAANAPPQTAGQPATKMAEANMPDPNRVVTDATSDPLRAAPAASDPAKPPATLDPEKPLVPRYKAADQPVKRAGHVAVFVSRKEKKVFVRQGFVPLFDMPVEIDNPDQPLGIHVFTALGESGDGTSMRWNLMTVPNHTYASVEAREGRRRGKEAPKPVVHSGNPPSTAAQALERIHLPQEAIDRIDELLAPGSSLVIADDGLGRETGKGTDFVVLTR